MFNLSNDFPLSKIVQDYPTGQNWQDPMAMEIIKDHLTGQHWYSGIILPVEHIRIQKISQRVSNFSERTSNPEPLAPEANALTKTLLDS